VRRLLIVMLAAIAAFGMVASTAAAQDDTGDADTAPPVDVLQVNGLFDDIVVDEIGAAIERADEQGSQALVLQIDSRGAVVSDDVMAELLARVDEAPVAIGVWVGPSGARLYGTPAQLLAVADVTGMAPGSRVGNVGTAISDFDLGPGLNGLRSGTAGLSEARSLGVFKQRISDLGIATIINMVDAMDGYSENGVELDTTTETVTDSGVVQRETIAPVRFAKLGLVDQLFHTRNVFSVPDTNHHVHSRPLAGVVRGHRDLAVWNAVERAIEVTQQRSPKSDVLNTTRHAGDGDDVSGSIVVLENDERPGQRISHD